MKAQRGRAWAICAVLSHTSAPAPVIYEVGGRCNYAVGFRPPDVPGLQLSNCATKCAPPNSNSESASENLLDWEENFDCASSYRGHGGGEITLTMNFVSNTVQQPQVFCEDNFPDPHLNLRTSSLWQIRNSAG